VATKPKRKNEEFIARLNLPKHLKKFNVFSKKKLQNIKLKPINETPFFVHSNKTSFFRKSIKKKLKKIIENISNLRFCVWLHNIR